MKIKIKNAHKKYQKGIETKCRFVSIGITFGAIVLLAVMSILAAYIPQLKNPVELVSRIGTILDFEYCKLSKDCLIVKKTKRFCFRSATVTRMIEEISSSLL